MKFNIFFHFFKAYTSETSAALDEFLGIFLEDKRTSSRGAETRNSALSIWSSGSEKKTASLRISLKREKNNQRNFPVEPKQEILKMCHFTRIERKFGWNQYRKVLIPITANQFSYGVASCLTELNKST